MVGLVVSLSNHSGESDLAGYPGKWSVSSLTGAAPSKAISVSRPQAGSGFTERGKDFS